MDHATPIRGPIEDDRRIQAMDVARGFALLGIFIVNVQTFAEPFGAFLAKAPESADLVTRACFYIDKAMCEGKFYALFSMLFGMGMVMQMRSIESRGAKFVPIYLRRLAVLLAIGLLHALLLWYGDILAVYSVCGVVLMLCRKFQARTMFCIAAGLVFMSSVFFAGFSALDALSPDTVPTPAIAVAADSPVHTPFFELIEAYRDGRLRGGPDEPLFMALEGRAYHDGPFLDAFLFRVSVWSFFIVFAVLGMGWHILAMFFVGAGLLKSGFFEAHRRPLRNRLILIGFTVGLAGSWLLAILPAWAGNTPGVAAMGALAFILAPMLSLGYISLITNLVESRRLTGITSVLSATGRMALTNYLAQTIISTAVFYWWGLAQFGEWTRGERYLFVLGVFIAQCLASVLWMRLFRYGPIEWVWRSLTYLTLVPMRRNLRPAANDGAPA